MNCTIFCCKIEILKFKKNPKINFFYVENENFNYQNDRDLKSSTSIISVRITKNYKKKKKRIEILKKKI